MSWPGQLESAVDPNPSDLLHVTDDTGVSDGSTTDSKINKEDKATQRGPQVAQSYLEALLSKANVVITDYAQVYWIQRGEETWVLDNTLGRRPRNGLLEHHG